MGIFEMVEDEKKRFAAIWKAAQELYGRDATREALRLAWGVLVPFPLESVERALQHCLQHGQFAPKPADVVAALQSSDGRPGPEEAWALLPHDEHHSAWWCDEMAEAWGIVANIASSGDKIAARKSFLEIYSRLIATARDHGRPVRWSFTPGLDRAGRALAVNDGLRRGYCTLATAKKLAPSFDFEAGKELPKLGFNELLAIADQREKSTEEITKAKQRIADLKRKLKGTVA